MLRGFTSDPLNLIPDNTGVGKRKSRKFILQLYVNNCFADKQGRFRQGAAFCMQCNF